VDKGGTEAAKNFTFFCVCVCVCVFGVGGEESSIKYFIVHKIIVSAVKRVEFISDMGLYRPVVLRSPYVCARMRKKRL
jgi:hypothetical protein